MSKIKKKYVIDKEAIIIAYKNDELFKVVCDFCQMEILRRRLIQNKNKLVFFMQVNFDVKGGCGKNKNRC